MSSSFTPTLVDVLYYVPGEGYGYEIDNRPLYNLDTNIKNIAGSLHGIGYGEHATVGGASVPVGKLVKLFPNGKVSLLQNVSPIVASDIIGLVIGQTVLGLNKVIWSAALLDVSTFGITLPGNTAGVTLYADVNSSSLTLSSAGALPVAIVKNSTYITFTGGAATAAGVSESSALLSSSRNDHNLYGFSRMRNVLASIATGNTPVPYTKITSYMSDYTANANEMNPLSFAISAGETSISVDGTAALDYSYLAGYVVKERYTNFSNNVDGVSDPVSFPGGTQSWTSTAYPLNLTGSVNHELESLGTAPTQTPDYANPANTSLFKRYTIDKYYQYAKVLQSSPLSGKPTVIVTVFNPDVASAQLGVGGEASQHVVFIDFIFYDGVTGRERKRSHLVFTGGSARSIFTNTSLIPSALLTLNPTI